MKKFVSVFLCIALLSGLFPGMGVFAQYANDADDFQQMLEHFRREMFSPGGFSPHAWGFEPPQIFIDGSEVVHTPPLEDVVQAEPWGVEAFGIAPLTEFVPYNVGAVRTFAGGVPAATLIMQGRRVNIWAADATMQIDGSILAHLDYIVDRMEVSFAPFAGVRIYPPSPLKPIVGDVHRDGRINLILHNYTGGGFFQSGDYHYIGGRTPIAAVHVHAGFADSSSPRYDRNMLYNVFAHEFQHLLFHMYFSVYTLITSGMNPPLTVTSGQFLWLNEAMSELAGFLYSSPGSETIMTGRAFSASGNSYAETSLLINGVPPFGDFVNFNNSLKNYGMSMLYGILMHRAAENNPNIAVNYTRSIYDFFRAQFPPSETPEGFWANQHRIQSATMPVWVGNAFNATGLTFGWSGMSAFQMLYFIFMENFIADGGEAVGVPTFRFLNSNYSAHRLWGIRPSLGTGSVFNTSTGNTFFPLTHLSPLPSLHSGGSVTLTGFNGTAPLGATHERLYLLPGSYENPFLNITLTDNAPNNTMFYVAIPNDAPGAVSDFGNRTLGSAGATVHQLNTNGMPNIIYTGGQNAYFFAVTLFRDVVGVQVNYEWLEEAPHIPQPIINLSYFDEYGTWTGDAYGLNWFYNRSEEGGLDIHTFITTDNVLVTGNANLPPNHSVNIFPMFSSTITWEAYLTGGGDVSALVSVLTGSDTGITFNMNAGRISIFDSTESVALLIYSWLGNWVDVFIGGNAEIHASGEDNIALALTAPPNHTSNLIGGVILTPRQSFALQNFDTPLGKGVTPPSQASNLIGGVISGSANISVSGPGSVAIFLYDANLLVATGGGVYISAPLSYAGSFAIFAENPGNVNVTPGPENLRAGGHLTGRTNLVGDLQPLIEGLTTDLNNLIREAEELLADTQLSTDGEDIPMHMYWATEEVIAIFYGYINAARDVAA
ncbi:MAG: hypothetical protein FWF79_10570 [Defluviitaleaceae bacterium]|nr:hypothetical protein [Defluviitaleaceae bacterium]